MRRWLSYAALLAISLGCILLADFTTSHLGTSSGVDPRSDAARAHAGADCE